ncbi:hypothetical protein SLEP1_g52281 [Rubroshorea leprosula]|uniref:Reverse transcriptase domain-containing protein n=1 Tax=Rubroshorea leprosula TaxID=152421 RepID=A0AAV5M5S5_9ROSI|nr:hypothetical protein SLEP1_g52281 [Rubroshorea leprosula]
MVEFNAGSLIVTLTNPSLFFASSALVIAQFHVKDKKELERKLDQIWIENRKLWVNTPRYDEAQKDTRVQENKRHPESKIQRRSYVEVVRGQQANRQNEEGTTQLIENQTERHRQSRSKSRAGKLSNNGRQVWQEKGKSDRWVGFEYNVKAEEYTWLDGCYVGKVHNVEMVRNLQEKFYMEGYFSCRIRAMGGKLVLLDGDDKDEVKALVEMASEWLGRWFEEVRPWSPEMVADERFVWIRCQGVPLNAWGPEFFASMGASWGKFICLDDSTSQKRRFDIARFLISTPSMNTISVRRQIKINGSFYNVKFTEEEFTNSFFSLKQDFMPTFQSESEDYESWSLGSENEGFDFGNMAEMEQEKERTEEAEKEDDEVAHTVADSLEQVQILNYGKTKAAGELRSQQVVNDENSARPGEMEKSNLGQMKILNRSHKRKPNPQGASPSNVESTNVGLGHKTLNPSLLLDKEMEESRIGEAESATDKKLGGELKWKQSQSAEEQRSEGVLFRPDLESDEVQRQEGVQGRRGFEHAEVYSQEENWFREEAEGKEEQRREGDLIRSALVSDEQQRHEGDHFRRGLEHAEERNQDGDGFGEEDDGDDEQRQEGDLTCKGCECEGKERQNRKLRQMKGTQQKRRKKIILCSSVYQREEAAGERKQRLNGHRRKIKKSMEEKQMLEFLRSPEGEVADISIGDSGIQNCNRMLKKQLQNQLAKEIWQLAKQLGATADNDDVILEKIEEMECRDRQAEDVKRKREEDNAQKELIEGNNFIGVCGTWGEDQTLVYVLNVYSSCLLMGKRTLWEDLLNLMNRRRGKWCIGGDFNAIRKVGEREGCRSLTTEMREFDSFIQNAGLVDLSLVGRKYTWYSSNSQCMSRLDRFLLSEEWLTTWGDVKQWGLERSVSDHCPILLKNERVDWGPKPFKFFDAWLEQPECMEVIKKAWNSTAPKGWKGFKLKEKLKRAKNALKEWSGKYMADTDCKIKEAERVIAIVDEKGEDGTLTAEDIEIRKGCFIELWRNLRIKESMWQQKARKMWLKEGDANTKFFHSCVKGRWRRNEIISIQINNKQLRGVAEIREEVASYFQGLFTEEKWQRPRLDGINFNQLSQTDSESLTAVFFEEEIKNAVWDCDSSKSPGPDGFNFRFIKVMWEDIKHDIISFAQEFHESGKLVRGSNASFIVLIPKVENPQRIEEYRPISLIGVMYKIIAKLLANRLRKVLDKVIGEQQMAFIGGRQLMDSVVIANEVIDEAKRKNTKSFIFKVDFEKAYDKVSWDFIEYMFGRMGFPIKWRKWIRECLQSSMISILLNGSPTREFQVSKGIRQVVKELYKGVKIGNGSVMVSHLQYADDTIFFGEAIEENILAIKCIMRTFKLVSGLKINYGKSQLMGVGIEDSWKRKMAYRLCCKEGEFPFKYLGIPIGGNHRKLAMWQPLVDSFKKKLASWKGRHLSFGGRITLINSVLSSLPVFMMSAYQIPKGILYTLDKIRRCFFWGGGEELKKTNWVKWERVCKQKKYGGLGVRDLRIFNLALMGKWWGRLANIEKGLWKSVVKGKYGQNGGHWLDWVRDGRNVGSLWWKDVRNLNVGDGAKGGWLSSGFRMKIGEGKDGSFWWDEWCGEVCLANKFPRLYLLSTGKENKCHQMGQNVNGTWKWNLAWRRTLFEWEEEDAKELKRMIENVTITPGQPDKWEWIHSNDGQYSTKTAYLELVKQRREPEEAEIFKRIWSKMLPSKVAAFNWKVMLDRIPTKTNLLKRGIVKDTGERKCVLCDNEDEDSNHLFLNCSIARRNK